jgi:hypothetical protein
MKRVQVSSLISVILLATVAHADDLGQRRLFETLRFYAQTSDSNGGEVNASSDPEYRVYEEGTFMFSGTMTRIDTSFTTGFYSQTFNLIPTNGFERGKQYSIRFKATVSSVNKADFHTFTLHPTETLVQHDGNNAQSGFTARSRIETAPTGTVVVLSPGVFDIGTAQILIPSGVSVRGAGIGSTQITKSNAGICIVPGDRSIVEELTIDARPNGQGYGSDGAQQFDDALLRNAQIKGEDAAIFVSGSGASTLTIEQVWLESDKEGIIAQDAGHRISVRDAFLKAAGTDARGISIARSGEVRGTRVIIDITSGSDPIGVSASDTALVELFDSGIWVDPAEIGPSSINVASSTAKVRLVNCEFDRSLIKGQTQQIRDVFSPLRPTLLTGAAIATLTSPTQFTLTTGPPENNALNGRLIVITDNADGRRKSVGVVSGYIGSSRQVTLTSSPVFTIGVGDLIDAIVEGP